MTQHSYFQNIAHKVIALVAAILLVAVCANAQAQNPGIGTRVYAGDKLTPTTSGEKPIGLIFWVSPNQDLAWVIDAQQFNGTATTWYSNSVSTSGKLVASSNPATAYLDTAGYTNTRLDKLSNGSNTTNAVGKVALSSGWYIPSLGQWLRVVAVHQYLNAILNSMEGATYLYIGIVEYGTSTCSTAGNVWTLENTVVPVVKSCTNAMYYRPVRTIKLTPPTGDNTRRLAPDIDGVVTYGKAYNNVVYRNTTVAGNDSANMTAYDFSNALSNAVQYGFITTTNKARKTVVRASSTDFVGASNYRLSTSSTLADVALTAQVSGAKDVEGLKRVIGTAVDYGAYERRMASSLTLAAVTRVYNGQPRNVDSVFVRYSNNTKQAAGTKVAVAYTFQQGSTTLTSAPKDVGTYSVTATFAGNDSLAACTSAVVNLVITKSPLTASGIIIKDKRYNGSDTAVVAKWGTLSKFTGDIIYVDSTSGKTVARFNNKNVGTAKPVTFTAFKLLGRDTINYQFTLPAGLTGNVYKDTLTLTGLTVDTLIYNGATVATKRSWGTLKTIRGNDNVKVDTTTNIVANFNNKNVGTNKPVTYSKAFTLTGVDADNYFLKQPTSVTGTIKTRSLTATGLVAASKVYTGTDSAWLTNTGTLVNKVTGDNVSISFTGLVVKFNNKNVGINKPVTVSTLSLTGTDATNYVLANSQFSGLTANVDSAPMNISGFSIANKVYDGTTKAKIGSIGTLVGIKLSDVVSLDTAGYTATFSDKKAEVNKNVTLSRLKLKGADAGNYKLVQPANLKGNITPKSITVSGITIRPKVYDGTTSAVISSFGQLNGVISGDVVNIVSAGVVANFTTADVGNAKVLGVSAISLSGADNANYTLVQPALGAITGNITPKALRLNGFAIANKVYDANTSAVISSWGTLDTIVDHDDVSVLQTGVTAHFNTKNSGIAKPVTVDNITLQGAKAANYTLLQPSGLTANISNATLTISNTAINSKIYDGTDNAAAQRWGTLTGVKSGDNVTLDTSAAVAKFNNKLVADGKPITLSGLVLSGFDRDNYTLVIPGNLFASISKRTLNLVGISVTNKIYNGDINATLTSWGTLDAVVNGDNVQAPQTGVSIAFDTKNVGNSKTITISPVTLTGTDAPNYTLVQPTYVRANITQCAIEVSPLTGSSKVFGTSDPAFTYNIEPALYSGDVASGVLGREAGESVGKYAYKLGTLTAGSNYSITFTSADSFAIVAQGRTIVVGSLQSKTYGSADPVFTYTVNPPLQSGENITGALSRVSGESAGEYFITLGNLALVGNTLTLAPQKFTINKRDLTLSGFTVASRLYNADTMAVYASLGTLNKLVGDDVSIDPSDVHLSFNNKLVGTAKPVKLNTPLSLIGAEAGNYKFVQPSGLTANIYKDTLHINLYGAVDKVYDGATTATLTYDNLGQGGVLTGIHTVGSYTDLVNVAAGAQANFANAKVGHNKGVWVSQLALTGADAANYHLKQPDSLRANITPKELSISGFVVNNKVYNGSDTATIAGVGSLSGVVGSDNVTIYSANTTLKFNNKNVGANKPVTLVTNLELTGTDKSNYTLAQPTGLTASITPRQLTANGIIAKNKKYDGSRTAHIGMWGNINSLPTDSVYLDTLSITAQFDTRNVGVGKNVNFVNFAVAGIDAFNYSITAPSGITANVYQDTVTVYVDTTLRKAVDASDPAFTYTLDRPLNIGDGPSDVMSGTLSRVAGEAVGSYAITEGTLTAGTNYYQKFVSHNFVIYRTNRRIIANAGQRKVYGETDPTFTYKVDPPLANGDVLTGQLGRVAGEIVDLYQYNLGTLASDKYTLEFIQPAIDSIFYIAPKPLTVTGMTVADKVYNGGTAATLASVGTLNKVGSDNVTIDEAQVTIYFDNKNAGTSKNIYAAPMNLTGANAGNYTLIQPTGLTGNILPKTIAINGFEASSKIYNSDTTTSISNLGVLVGVEVGDVVRMDTTGIQLRFTNKNVGNAKPVNLRGAIHLAGADSANYTLTQPSGLTANITPATLHVAGFSVDDKTYDGNTSANIANAGNLTPVFAGDNVSITPGATVSFADKFAGNGKLINVSMLSLQGADGGNYQLGQPQDITASITKRTLTISGTTIANKVYDAGVNATVSNFGTLNNAVAGDIVTLNTTGASATFSDKNVGNTKQVHLTPLTLNGADSVNYTLTQPANLTADITPFAVTITPLAGQGKKANTDDPILQYGVNPPLYGGDYLTGELTRDAGAAAGDYNILQGTLASDANYSLAFTSDVKFSINNNILLVLVTPGQSKIYGTADPATFAYALDSTPAGISISGRLERVAGEHAGSYAVGLGSLSAAGYTFLLQSANFIIHSRSITIDSLYVANKTYDATRQATLQPTWVLKDTLAQDSITIDFANLSLNFDDKNAANNKLVRMSGFRLTGKQLSSYTYATPDSLYTASIYPDSLTLLGLHIKNKVYDATTAANLSNNGILQNVISGDMVSADTTNVRGVFSDKNVGNGKTITGITPANLFLMGADAANYVLRPFTVSTADITPATLSLQGLTINNKTYDGTLDASAQTFGTLTPILGSDDVSLNTSGATFSFSDKFVGGNKNVSIPTFDLLGVDAVNYRLSQPSVATADITKANIAVSGLTIANKKYDAGSVATVSNWGNLIGTISGDDVQLQQVGVTASFTGVNNGEDVGEDKEISLTPLTLTGAKAGNYNLIQPAYLKASIYPDTVSVVPTTLQHKTYGTPDPAFTYTTTPQLLPGDVMSGNLARELGENAGRYAITQGTLNAGFNYVVKYTADTFTIIPAVRQIAVNQGQSKHYGDPDPEFTYTVSPALQAGEVATGKLERQLGNIVGSYTVDYVGTLSLGDNYSLAVTPAEFLITPRALAISNLHISNKVYDGDTVAVRVPDAPNIDKLPGDDVDVDWSGATFNFRNKNVAVNKPVTVTNISLAGTSANNYVAETPQGITADITPREIFAANMIFADKTYNATDAAQLKNLGTLSDIIAGDNVRLDSASIIAAFDSKNVGSAKSVNIISASLAGTDSANYIFVKPTTLAANIKPYALTITGFAVNSKPYDGTSVATIGNFGTLDKFAADDVSVNTSDTWAHFNNEIVGADKPVTVSMLMLTGAASSNYTLNQPSGIKASITRAPLMLTRLIAQSKLYDGSDSAKVVVIGFPQNNLGSQPVSLNTSGAKAKFENKNAGTNKKVHVSGIQVTGDYADNYYLLDTIAHADISPDTLTVTGLTIANKTYDGTTGACFAAGAVLHTPISGDNVYVDTLKQLAHFDTPAAGNNKNVTINTVMLAGSDSMNYILIQPSVAGLQANILKAPLTIQAADTALPVGYIFNRYHGRYSLMGLVNGETVSVLDSLPLVAISPSIAVNAAPGIYPNAILVTGGAARNYNISRAPGTLTILNATFSKEYNVYIGNTKLDSAHINGYFAYADCGQTLVHVAIELDTNYFKQVTMNGEAVKDADFTLAHYGNNNAGIVLTNLYGDIDSIKFTIGRLMEKEKAFKDYWNDVLLVPYTIEGVNYTTVDWYRHTPSGDVLVNRDATKGYLEVKENGAYYAILNSEVKTCDVNATAHNSSLKAYPNPVSSSSILTIEIPNTKPDDATQVEVLNASGQLMYTHNVVGTQAQIASPETNGIYMVRINTQGISRTLKILVKE